MNFKNENCRCKTVHDFKIYVSEITATATIYLNVKKHSKQIEIWLEEDMLVSYKHISLKVSNSPVKT